MSKGLKGHREGEGQNHIYEAEEGKPKRLLGTSRETEHYEFSGEEEDESWIVDLVRCSSRC